MTDIAVSSKKQSKILTLERKQEIAVKIQEFLKDLGIVRDWRKDFMAEERKTGSFSEDTYYYADTKKADVRCTAFIGVRKIIFQIIYSEEKEDNVLQLINKHFT